jgi:hypothetical protein
MIIPSPAAHSSSTPFMAPQYLELLSLPHKVTYLPYYYYYYYCKYTFRKLSWGGGWGVYIKWRNVHKDFFLRKIGAGSRAQTTHSERSNDISPYLFPYGTRLSEKCAGSNYSYNDNPITSAHQNYRSTIHTQASQNYSFTERMIGMYSLVTSKQVLNGYPGLIWDSFAGTLRARDVRPLASF